MTPVERRLATLDRQLARYLAQRLPPATRAAQEKRRLTWRRRVIRDNLRQQRALREQGSEVGWRSVTLTEKESQLAEELATTTDPLRRTKRSKRPRRSGEGERRCGTF